METRLGKYLPARAGRLEPWSPDFTPYPESPQEAAYYSEADELLYGGAAGGGKSYLLVGLGLSEHHSSIIFRREYPQLAEIEDVIDAMTDAGAPGGAVTNKNKHRWTLPDGRFMETGAMQRLGDWKKYKGRPHDLIGFDELTEFARKQYRMAILWNRSAIPGQRKRVVATTNPPLDEEQAWVIEEWAPWLDPEYSGPGGSAVPGELRWYYYDGDTLTWATSPSAVEVNGRVIYPKSRTFIPAKLDDNPALLESDYGRTIDALPEELRKAFRDGDFATGHMADPFQVIPTAWVQAAQARWKDRATEGPLTQLGVDPARGGKDMTVLAPRYGNYLGELVERPGKQTPDGPTVAAEAVSIAEPGTQIVVDVIGIGASVYDCLAGTEYDVSAFNASERDPYATDTSGKLQFSNRRAEAYWRLREMLDPNSGEDIALPPSRELRRELCAPRWKLRTTGIQVESKEEIKKRLGHSPDRADAVVYAFYNAQSPDIIH